MREEKKYDRSDTGYRRSLCAFLGLVVSPLTSAAQHSGYSGLVQSICLTTEMVLPFITGRDLQLDKKIKVL